MGSAFATLERSTWNAEVELIAVSLGTTVGVALASVEFLSLAGDTHVEFVADIVSLAIVVRSALSEVV